MFEKALYSFWES